MKPTPADPPEAARPVAVTVVVPAHGRAAALSACLSALARQTLAAERFEVVVVDDGSPQPLSADLVPSPLRPRLRLLRQTNRGPAAARNAGAAAARAPLLAFTDDDCRPLPGWLAALVAAAAPGAVVGGRTVNALEGTPCAAASHLLLDYIEERRRRGVDPTPFLPSNNLAIHADDFAALGGFDATFPTAAGEDRDLCDRARAAGLELRRTPDAVVEHAHPMRLRGYLRQHFAYGRGAWDFHRRRAERRARFPLPRPSFYLGLLVWPWRRGRHDPLRQSLLLAASQLATAAGFAARAVERRGRR